MEPTEQWRPIPGWEGLYEVSDLGRVKSLHGRYAGFSVMSPSPDRNGYWWVSLKADGLRKRASVHRLVLLAFVGPCPDGLESRHVDDDKDNNTLGNLKWGTKSENTHDKVRNGRHPMANKTHCKRGHEFTPENTRVLASGSRCCLACKTNYNREYRLQGMEGVKHGITV